RLWRCGNWGNVASVLIEKPHRGDFLPIVDGGYALQYSPLLEYREGRGMVLFCQMDVTGRMENDPAAETLLVNILRYVEGWQPPNRRLAVYAGEAAGLAWLQAYEVEAKRFDGTPLTEDQVLVLGPGAVRQLGSSLSRATDWIKGGGRVLALGLEQSEADQLLPFKLTMRSAEHIAAWFPSCNADSPLAGITPEEVYKRDAR